jgi:hypothetical protein
MQSERIKTPHTHTLNDKGAVWLWHRRARQAVEAQGRLNYKWQGRRACLYMLGLRCCGDGDDRSDVGCH